MFLSLYSIFGGGTFITPRTLSSFKGYGLIALDSFIMVHFIFRNRKGGTNIGGVYGVGSYGTLYSGDLGTGMGQRGHYILAT